MMLGGGAAGLFGSLLGLGGGLLIVPLLTLGFDLPLREAVGVSLVSIIVTSGASAGIYLQRQVANLRLGMTLELFTATGALVGGIIAFLVSDRMLAGLFTALLLYTAFSMVRARGSSEEKDANLATASPTASSGLRHTLGGPGYEIERFRWGVVGSVGAGVVSALLGVGGGIVKVPVMHLVMGVPLRVATATSNLMIGITASTSAIIYLLRGQIDAYIAGLIAIGVFVGASIGSRIAPRVDVRFLRILFVVVLLYTAFEMARRALAV
jgi:uncharacterized membrane protein YfcA